MMMVMMMTMTVVMMIMMRVVMMRVLMILLRRYFGDGAPALERDRPMLFEQVARRLLNIEEHEYQLNSDLAPYRASCTSRFNT